MTTPETTPEQSRPDVRAKAPVSLTGGFGFRFENNVAARFLLDMLCAKNALGLEFGRIEQVNWQVRDQGWLLDDLSIDCKTTEGTERSVGLSIKSNEQVNSVGFNREFIHYAWSQWFGRGTSRVFRRGNDAVGLVTGDIDHSVERAWSVLHRETVQTTPERMAGRLSPAAQTGGGVQSSKLQRDLFESLRRPQAFTNEPASEHEEVLFLRDVRLLHFDFEAQGSLDEVSAIADCQSCLSGSDPIEARNLWERLVGIADQKRPVGGSLNLPGLLAELRGQFRFADHPDFRADWQTLDRHTNEGLADVRSKIADAAELPRSTERAEILRVLAEHRSCLVIGESGSGKSAIAKTIAVEDYGRAIWFTGDMLDCTSQIGMERSLGLVHPLCDILRSAPASTIVVFDGIDGFSPAALKICAGIIAATLADPDCAHVHILLTVQVEAAARIMRQMVQHGAPDSALNSATVSPPSTSDITKLISSLPNLEWMALRPELKRVLTNLKILDWAARTLQSPNSLADKPYVGLTVLIDLLWEKWTENDDGGIARAHVLQAIGVIEAERLTSGVPLTSLDLAEKTTIPDLVSADLVRVRQERASFTHDLLGDCARLRVLVGENNGAFVAGRDRADSPRWHRPIRLFGQRLLEQASGGIELWRQSVQPQTQETSDLLVRDLFLEALFLASNASELLERAWSVLIANEAALLNRLLDRFRFVGTLPDQYTLSFLAADDDAERYEHLARIPFWPVWGPLISALHAHIDDVAELASYQGARTVALWLKTMPFELAPGTPMPWRREAAQVALAIARETQAKSEEHQFFGSRSDSVVYEAAILGAREFPDEVADLCLQLARRRDTSPELAARVREAQRKQIEERRVREKEPPRKKQPAPIPYLRGRRRPPWPDGPRSRVEHGFQAACLDSAAFACLVQANPDAALEVLLAVCIEEPKHDDHLSSSSLEDSGLAYWQAGDPPAYFRGPVLPFLRLAPEQGLSFVLKLVNFATWRVMGGDAGVMVDIGGSARLWRGDSRVFRWHHDWPLMHSPMVHSALMALEFWLYEQLEKGAAISPAVSRILAESESMAFAGLLIDIAKRDPRLLEGVMKPLFNTWEFWVLDFSISNLRAGGWNDLLGYWGSQPAPIIALARAWHRLPHRSYSLLSPNGAVPTNMLSKPENRSFFESVRSRWRADLNAQGEPNNLRLLVERIDPENYTFKQSEGGEREIDFQWPEAIARENDASLRKIGLEQNFMVLPMRSRQILDAGARLPDDELTRLLTWLQEVEANHQDLATEGEDAVHRLRDVILAGVAVLVVLHLDWLVADEARLNWCLDKLAAVVRQPPERMRFDSELTIGDNKWDAFAAECGVSLLANDGSDHLARQLVAAGLTDFRYSTTALTMARAFVRRADMGDDFNRLVSLAVRWAELRGYQVRSDDAALAEDRVVWLGRKASLINAFLDGSLDTALPDFARLNADAQALSDDLYAKQFPDLKPVRRARRHQAAKPHSPEKLYPDRLGLDERVLTNAFAWLDLSKACTPAERADWLAIMRSLLGLTLHTLPTLDDADTQEIDGLPTDFDSWVFGVVARNIPQLTADESPEQDWCAILALGPAAHQWIERFYWYWHTDGVPAAASPDQFANIWRAMIQFALDQPDWNTRTYSSHGTDAMLAELLGFDGRWSAVTSDATYTGAVGSLSDIFERAAARWSGAPRLLNGFLWFATQPACSELLLPSLLWLQQHVVALRSYDWRSGVEDNLIEYLSVCWERDGQRVAADPKLQSAFLAMLSAVVSRGNHAAIALRDRIVGTAAA